MDEVELVEYDPRWPQLFADEAERLRATLDFLVDVQHFGSTAIPGLAAKPIIDILITVRSLDEARARAIEPLHRLGFLFWAENPRVDRLFFVKGLPPVGARRTHHLHVTEPNGALSSGLVFRDALRSDAAEARRYEALKRELAERHRSDREAYTAAKAAYVEGIVRGRT